MNMISSLFNIDTSFFHSNVHTFLKYFFNSVIIFQIASLYYNGLPNVFITQILFPYSLRVFLQYEMVEQYEYIHFLYIEFQKRHLSNFCFL
jgi:hypothetical protein